MRWLGRIIFVAIVAFGLSYTPFEGNEELYTVVYTVIGIMFSIALSQLMSFSFSEVKNRKYVSQWREELKRVRSHFIILFTLSTIAIVAKPYGVALEWKILKFDISDFIFTFLLFCLGYFIYNFIQLAFLKDAIDDEISKYT